MIFKLIPSFLLEIIGVNQGSILAFLPYSSLVVCLLSYHLIPRLPTKTPLLETFNSTASCHALFTLYYTTLVQTYFDVGICYALAKLSFCT